VGNHHNAWRPAHIHFSLFGPAFATPPDHQMYFPDDPLLALGSDLQFRARCGGAQTAEASSTSGHQPDFRPGLRFDIVLRGRNAIPPGRRTC